MSDQPHIRRKHSETLHEAVKLLSENNVTFTRDTLREQHAIQAQAANVQLTDADHTQQVERFVKTKFIVQTNDETRLASSESIRNLNSSVQILTAPRTTNNTRVIDSPDPGLNNALSRPEQFTILVSSNPKERETIIEASANIGSKSDDRVLIISDTRPSSTNSENQTSRTLSSTEYLRQSKFALAANSPTLDSTGTPSTVVVDSRVLKSTRKADAILGSLQNADISKVVIVHDQSESSVNELVTTAVAAGASLTRTQAARNAEQPLPANIIGRPNEATVNLSNRLEQNASFVATRGQPLANVAADTYNALSPIQKSQTAILVDNPDNARQLHNAILTRDGQGNAVRITTLQAVDTRLFDATTGAGLKPGDLVGITPSGNKLSARPKELVAVDPQSKTALIVSDTGRIQKLDFRAVAASGDSVQAYTQETLLLRRGEKVTFSDGKISTEQQVLKIDAEANKVTLTTNQPGKSATVTADAHQIQTTRATIVGNQLGDHSSLIVAAPSNNAVNGRNGASASVAAAALTEGKNVTVVTPDPSQTITSAGKTPIGEQGLADLSLTSEPQIQLRPEKER